MKINRNRAILIMVVICLLLIVNGVVFGERPANTKQPPGISSTSPPQSLPENTPPASASPPENTPAPETSPPETSPETPPETPRVEYNGIVEHLFFHEVIAYPELAFNGNHQQAGYDEYMVTVSEYNKILNSLYEKDYILVNMNDVWSEYTDDNGTLKMRRNTLMIPEGKKPLILSFDDISFYEYMQEHGFMQKLFVGDDGEIWAAGLDKNGEQIVTQDLTAVTILNNFVKAHPDFSLDGAMGCIALTGYEGILGYRTQTDANDTSLEFELNRMREIAAARPVVQKLKDTGWYFASHSWGHINLNTASFAAVKKDADRWLSEVGSLVGETKLFIYPFGSRLDGDDVTQTGEAFKYYHSLGFRIFASVGIESFSKIKSDIAAVICDRMHSDGATLRRERERYLKFYDAAEVFDPMRLDEYGRKW